MKWANPKIESKNIEFGVNASGNIMHTLCKLENNISCTPTQYGDNNKRRQYSLRTKKTDTCVSFRGKQKINP